jgi:hypothetical protein
MWEADAPAALQKRVTKLLRDLGLMDAGRPLTLEQLAGTAYRRSAAEVLTPLVAKAKLTLPGEIEDLILVPDGVLWYVPFELFPVSEDESPAAFVAKCKVHYSPTAGLALAPRGNRRAAGSTAVFLGKLHPREADSTVEGAFESFSQVVPGAVPLRPDQGEQGSALAALFDRMVVLDDLANLEQPPLDTTVLRGQGGASGSRLATWLELPFAAPEVVMLPGFHSAAEAALKKMPAVQPGDELFLPICSILATGARTALISRWRTGGQTSLDLMREFAAGLADQEEPDDAWQRAILLTSESRLDFDREPRVEAKSAAEPPTASHPFFWSGYLLIDTGVVEAPPPAAEAAQPGAPGDEAAEDMPPGEEPRVPGEQPAAVEPQAPKRRSSSRTRGAEPPAERPPADEPIPGVGDPPRRRP